MIEFHMERARMYSMQINNPPQLLSILRQKRLVVLLWVLVFAGYTHILIAYATPSAPVLLVNHTLVQCIEQVYLSDECSYCRVVNGWEISQDGVCPQGYQTIQVSYQVTDENRPLDCVEVARNDWLACSWGRYPSMTPYLTATPQPPLVEESSNPLVFEIIAMIVVLVLAAGLVIWGRKKR